MKRIFTHLSLAITLLLCTASLASFAQTTVVVNGPSKDALTTPPAAATDVSKIYCDGSAINLTGPAFIAGYKYDWYKIDNTGTKQLVKEGTTDNTYSETASGAGYYDYQLVIINTAGCSSPITNINKVYVLPTLNLALTPIDPICSGGQTTGTLKLTQPLDGAYTYTYQWQRNGQNVSDADGGKGYPLVVKETASSATAITYTLQVSYSLNSGCKGTANASVTVVDPPQTPTITFN
ncbi:hypothetical protein [Mucilaginibacter jinjuensis]|uniref:Ig-like domain-containing protein n=1 Tax=Mucilaginibacter jinjuensis TaxID=1176721 RepID=A0ABY7T108_9SPHI|nr:hypothetical protein [Mucilaginibacter jinjuensis]WCT10031.1 hypothetical protein PQO05_14960 [Mucilaginibacter jinjuensis]